MIQKMSIAFSSGKAKKKEAESRALLDKELEEVRALLDAEAKKRGMLVTNGHKEDA